jgi:hypothetical protein
MTMEQTECYETLAFKLQTSVNRPEESIRHSEQGESLKSRISYLAENIGAAIHSSGIRAFFWYYAIELTINL